MSGKSNPIALVHASTLVSPIVEIAHNHLALTESSNMITSDDDSDCQISARNKSAEDESKSDILSWDSEGYSFFVVNTKRFVAGPTKKKFKVARFNTFVKNKKLFQWGFVPLEGEKRNFAFRHTNLHRGDWGGCHMIRRNSTRPTISPPAEVVSKSFPRLVTTTKLNPEKLCSPISSPSLAPQVVVALDKASLEVKGEVSRNITCLQDSTVSQAEVDNMTRNIVGAALEVLMQDKLSCMKQVHLHRQQNLEKKRTLVQQEYAKIQSQLLKVQLMSKILIQRRQHQAVMRGFSSQP